MRVGGARVSRLSYEIDKPTSDSQSAQDGDPPSAGFRTLRVARAPLSNYEWRSWTVSKQLFAPAKRSDVSRRESDDYNGMCLASG